MPIEATRRGRLARDIERVIEGVSILEMETGTGTVALVEDLRDRRRVRESSSVCDAILDRGEVSSATELRRFRALRFSRWLVGVGFGSGWFC